MLLREIKENLNEKICVQGLKDSLLSIFSKAVVTIQWSAGHMVHEVRKVGDPCSKDTDSVQSKSQSQMTICRKWQAGFKFSMEMERTWNSQNSFD